MNVLFDYSVDFMKLPLLPPTIENCKKCCFYMYPNIPGDNCIRSDTSICQIGRNQGRIIGKLEAGISEIFGRRE